MKNKLPFVVLRSNDNCFLDIIRACALAKIEVIPIVFTWEGAEWISESSKYFKNDNAICNPAKNEKQAINDLANIGEKLLNKYGQKLMIIPSSDTNQTFLQNNYECFSKYFLQMGSDDFSKSIMIQLRKDSAAGLLSEYGVEIPKTISVCSLNDIEFAISDITYPCIYKPVIKDLVSSFQNTHNKKKCIECSTRDELKRNLEIEVVNGYELIVQEKIEFEKLEDEVSCYVYVDKSGEIRAISGQHKILEHPHPYGTGVISVPYYTEEFLNIAKKIVKAYKWRGFIGIEFMKNKKDGKWVVIETNLRPWISINYQASMGFNYVEYLYNDLYGECEGIKILNVDELMPIRVNLMMLINKYVADEKNVASAINKAGELINNNMGNVVFSYFVRDDTTPGLIECKSLKLKFKGHDGEIDKLYSLVQKNNELMVKANADR